MYADMTRDCILNNKISFARMEIMKKLGIDDTCEAIDGPKTLFKNLRYQTSSCIQ